MPVSWFSGTTIEMDVLIISLLGFVYISKHIYFNANFSIFKSLGLYMYSFLAIIVPCHNHFLRDGRLYKFDK